MSAREDSAIHLVGSKDNYWKRYPVSMEMLFDLRSTVARTSIFQSLDDSNQRSMNDLEVSK